MRNEKTLASKVKRALIRPTESRWFRWIYTPLVAITALANIFFAIASAMRGEFLWVANAMTAVFLIAAWCSCLVLWIRADDRDASWLPPMPDVLDMDDLSTSNDPRFWALMQSMETGKPVSINQGDDGIWRNSETGEILPVQGDVDGEGNH